MGGSSSEQQKTKALQHNQWLKYQAELANDKPTNIAPYHSKEMVYLQQLFALLDKKNLKSLQLKDFDSIVCLRDHPLYVRIIDLFQEQMKNIKAKRINFELFLHLLSVFHVKTEVQTKYRYVFRLYDTDKNQKIDSNDLSKIYRLIYQQSFMQEEDFNKLITETLIRFGNKGQIRKQNMIEKISEDQIREFISFRFNNTFI